MSLELVTERFAPGSLVSGTVYRVVRKLAEGGMGMVFEVEDTTIGKRYVLKTLLPSHDDRDEMARRMAAEARVLARLAHPNIVDVITAGITADERPIPFFVMERLAGRTLAGVLERQGRLDVETACRIAIDVLDALHHAHENGVTHRDVKPDNIFIHRASAHVTVTKLLDFGIMHFAGVGAAASPGDFFGTLRYVTPEAVTRGPSSPATDLFTTGLVLYEMLAGHGPWDDRGGGMARAYAHATALVPAFLQWGVAVPEVLERLISSALCKDPRGRPQDAAAFAHELRAVLETPVHALGVDRLATLDLRPGVGETEGLQELARTLIDVESFVPPRAVFEDVAPLVPRRAPLSTTAPTVVEPTAHEPEPPAMSGRPATRARRVVAAAGVLCTSLAAAVFWLGHSASAPSMPAAELPLATSAVSLQRAPSLPPLASAASSSARIETFGDAGATPENTRPTPRATVGPAPRKVPGVDF